MKQFKNDEIKKGRRQAGVKLSAVLLAGLLMTACAQNGNSDMTMISSESTTELVVTAPTPTPEQDEPRSTETPATSETASTEPSSSEQTTEETTEETSEPTTEETTEETSETTTETATTTTTEEPTEPSEPSDAVREVAEAIYPNARALVEDPQLARQFFPLAFLENKDANWADWMVKDWNTFLYEQAEDHLRMLQMTEPSEPITDPPAERPIITPTLMPAREPEVALSVTESPDGRSGDQLDEAYEVDGIVLVNKQHWVNENYRPLPDSDDRWGLIPEAREAFDAMQADAKEEGLTLVFASGYRTYELQEWLFNDYSEKNPDGEAGANRSSARPGQSEHQTGLALDIRNEHDGLTLAFGESAEGRWLWENSWRYGWILRYPQGKEHITGYVFEPWHFRYVGPEVAAEFGAFSTLTLEEYLNDTLSINAWRGH